MGWHLITGGEREWEGGISHTNPADQLMPGGGHGHGVLKKKIKSFPTCTMLQTVKPLYMLHHSDNWTGSLNVY